MENDLKLAFPVAYSSGFSKVTHLGFSKLEYISAMCLQGMLSNSTSSIETRISENMADAYTKDAVLLAKSLLTELEKEKK